MMLSQKDPAIERWHQMREDMYKGFTLTRDNVVPTLTLAVVIPVAFYYAVCADLVRSRPLPKVSSRLGLVRIDTLSAVGSSVEQERGWDLTGTQADVPMQRKLRKPEDIDGGLTKHYGQYDEIKTA
jgi:hypothetical protein